MAHRGGKGGPPNSVAAIRHALSVGAEAIELDVNQTADGVLVATHNAVLAGRRWVTDVTFRELLELDQAEWEHREALEVVDQALEAGATLYLDLKAIRPEGLSLIAKSWQREIADRRIIFAAARADVVTWVSENVAGAATSFLYYDTQLDLRSLAAFTKPTFVHPCFDHLPDPMRFVHEQYVERARSLGFGLVSWNELQPGRITRLGDLGFDFVCTDDPALAVDTLRTSRG